MSYRILVVEDQKEISDIVTKYLKNEGYESCVAKDGFEALDIFSNKDIHLVILDIMMPGINGFEVLKSIRQTSEVPVVILTAKQEEVDKLNGFDIGADDYVIKPFSTRELMKRVKVLIKRVYQNKEQTVLTCGSLELHTKSMKLFKNKKEIDITSAEYNLLLAMFKNKGRVLSRQQLIDLAYGYDYVGYDRNIDSYIKRIRKKIEENPKKPQVLVTKYGAGYIFGGSKI